jgi:hypothetical protein
MSEQMPQPNRILAEPATPQACAADYANRDRTGAANTQRGGATASAQAGIPRTTGGR